MRGRSGQRYLLRIVMGDVEGEFDFRFIGFVAATDSRSCFYSSPRRIITLSLSLSLSFSLRLSLPPLPPARPLPATSKTYTSPPAPTAACEP